MKIASRNDVTRLFLQLSLIIKCGLKSAFGMVNELEKHGTQIILSQSTGNISLWFEANAHHSMEDWIDTEEYRLNFRRSLEVDFTGLNASFIEELEAERERFYQDLETGRFSNVRRRLIEDLLDPEYYEKAVHPKRNHLMPTRVNVSMSLYQILDVNEHMQSLEVNVWMVQNWYDEFLDFNPRDYEMINKTIVPHDEIWIPDTYLYNSETLEQKKVESIMHAQIETGYWANDGLGARVQLMFPAIYKLSCRMHVLWFPYDVQNCTFIISSWTHDMETIDYWPTRNEVNLQNMARNEEWEVISFDFERVEQNFKCCKHPWVMLYAHLIIRRKPLYYIVNLVIPTSIITIVAVVGFFTPSSSSSERDEKLYLGINTLLTMSVMMLMVCNQMPSTSTYVPLMTIHSQKHNCRPLSRSVRRLINNSFVETFILTPPTSLIELWTEFGIVTERRMSMSKLDPILLAQLDPISVFSIIISNISIMPPIPAYAPGTTSLLRIDILTNQRFIVLIVHFEIG
ncbi:hypothetical protein WR25_07580 [Diploscapter pachys]|uniref:Neurotransmitter-gated ion-channel ligand-binding domain-containing protein n=1 Tax=Diploscapter pachys TaxID=2018661 RepID=A0A2A2LQA9_9BILA|nr:hypothetical protein WR25_07580 [Diploscapter pachys]